MMRWCVLLVISVGIGAQNWREDFDSAVLKLKSELLLLVQNFHHKMEKTIVQMMEERTSESKSRIEALVAKNRQLELQLLASKAEAPDRLGKQEPTLESWTKAGSCQELFQMDPSRGSGHYRIDPDGPDNGEGPIRVYCNMTSRSTLISHNIPGILDVEDCLGDGCHKIEIHYEAGIRQIIALIVRSRQCRQDFQFSYHCDDNRFGLVESSWFQDRHNISRPYSTCLRSTDPNDPELCHLGDCLDHIRPDVLPVTRLHFGRQPDPLTTLWPTSSNSEENLRFRSRFRLGPLECSGSSPGLRGIFTTTEASTQSTPISGTPCSPSPESNLPVSRSCPNDLGKSTTCSVLESGCYCLIQISLNWTQAVDFCKDWAMELVSIETREEQQSLRKWLTNYEGYYWWTSGSDERSEDRWIWTATGQPFNYTNWFEIWPKGGSDMNFMQIRSWAAYKWHARPIGDRDFAICEL